MALAQGWLDSSRAGTICPSQSLPGFAVGALARAFTLPYVKFAEGLMGKTTARTCPLFTLRTLLGLSKEQSFGKWEEEFKAQFECRTGAGAELEWKAEPPAASKDVKRLLVPFRHLGGLSPPLSVMVTLMQAGSCPLLWGRAGE